MKPRIPAIDLPLFTAIATYNASGEYPGVLLSCGHLAPLAAPHTAADEYACGYCWEHLNALLEQGLPNP